MQLGGNATVRYARGYYVPKPRKELNWQSNSLDNQNINKKRNSPKTIKSRQEELHKRL